MFTAKAAKNEKGRRYTTKAELAVAVGVHPMQITRWARRADWNFPRNPPWPATIVGKIQRWAADTLEKKGPMSGARDESPETKALRGDKLAAEVRKLRAQADQSEDERDKHRGRLMLADEVEAEWTKAGNVVRNGFANLSSQLVPLALSHGMPQEAAGEFGRQIDESVNGILRILSRNGSKDDPDSEE